MSEPFVSSRFLIREKPIAYPYYDLCLQDSQGPVFDLNVEMDSYNGSVYLRTDHVIEMGRTLGMATAEEVLEYNRTIEGLYNKIALLESQEDLKSELDRIVDRLRGILAPDPIESDEPDTGDSVAESDDSKSEETERKTIGPISL